jgi:hypothetical protein
MTTITHYLDEAIAPITDGSLLAVARETSGVALSCQRYEFMNASP